jgi:rhamnose utilization protein RhaD (predicted bifunctional aldolase and dehydrogenase)
MADLSALVALSRLYGSDPEWVLAGGGNTSFKNSSRLYVKASGTSLGAISAEGFCEIDRSKLDAMWGAKYPDDSDAREAAALADLMAARAPGEAKRPSVETLMHGLFPQAYVVHTHPAAINGITCGREGRAAFERLFGEEGIWVPFVDPGYVLAKTVRAELEAYRAKRGRVPGLMLMQNHGLLVAGESPEEIQERSAGAMAKVLGETKRRPDLSALSVDAEALAEATAVMARLARSAYGEAAALRFRSDAETALRSASREAFAPLSSAFSPDHIVYAGHEFALAAVPLGSIPSGAAPSGAAPSGAASGFAVEAAWKEYSVRNETPPRIVVVAGLGAFACAKGVAAAEAAIMLYSDACKVAAYAESFGGPSHMTKEKIDFIRNWEVEKYRSSVSTGK